MGAGAGVPCDVAGVAAARSTLVLAVVKQVQGLPIDMPGRHLMHLETLSLSLAGLCSKFHSSWC